MCYGYYMNGYNSWVMDTALAFGALSSAIQSIGGNRSSNGNSSPILSSKRNTQSNLVGDLLSNPVNIPSGSASLGIFTNFGTPSASSSMTNPFGGMPEFPSNIVSMSQIEADMVTQQKLNLLQNIYGYEPMFMTAGGFNNSAVSSGGSIFGNITGETSNSQNSELPSWYGTPIMESATNLPSLSNLSSGPGLTDLIGPQSSNPYLQQAAPEGAEGDLSPEGNPGANENSNGVQSGNLSPSTPQNSNRTVQSGALSSANPQNNTRTFTNLTARTQTRPSQVSNQRQASNNSGSNLSIASTYNGSAADLNAKLGGVMANKGQVFLDAQAKYGVNAALLASICMHESDNGKSKLAKNNNNVGGVRYPGKTEFRSYNSVDDCIMHIASFLKSGYIDKGITSIAQVGAKYCPTNDPTDTTGMNRGWGAGVKRWYNQSFV